MHLFNTLYAALSLNAFLCHAASLTSSPRASELVRWDEHSLFIKGERLMLLGGEFHPWRIPSPGLWIDVLQKIKGLGYNSVSFYVNWALTEGKEGQVRFNDAFALQPMIDAAAEVGLYLIARPGPYVNSELSGGGFPGRLQRIQGELRSTAPEFLNATELYIATVLDIITENEITKGGPIILVQPENEYSLTVRDDVLGNITFLDPEYMEWVKQQFLRNGVTSPLISNDMVPRGNWAPGTGTGELDIYAHDMYPFYRGCGSPESWADITPLSWDYTYQSHLAHSPSTPYAILEYQGGAPDPWGGVGLDLCAAKIGPEFARVFLKELVARGIKILNLYMTFGGTNWGNMGHPEGYTSYDHGAVIREDRRVDREKYSEAKLQSRWLTASRGYLTAVPQRATHALASTSDIITTPILGEETRFYVTRHTDYQPLEDTKYKLNVPTSHGNVTIPKLRGGLVLQGRDSKIHVTDYDVGGINLVYSSAEVYTWKKYNDAKTVLILYGGEGETHEFALPKSLGKPKTTCSDILICKKSGKIIVNWEVQRDRCVVEFEKLAVFLLWRNEAYNYWVLDLPDPATGTIPYVETQSALIVNGGYFLRNATFHGSTLSLTGDINTTTEFELISGAPAAESIVFNGKQLETTKKGGRLKAVEMFTKPNFKVPNLSSISWKKLEALPELSESYSDEAWTDASLKDTWNTHRTLSTPTSLYSGDYGYHAGSLIFRGHFIADGGESSFNITAQGGQASGFSVWLGDTFLGSFAGDTHATNQTLNLDLPSLDAGTKYIFTVLIDNMGYDMNFYVESEAMKSPRGILAYSLNGHSDEDIAWKITGNLGGEDYFDKVRGPYNEGAMYPERNGFHLPDAPTDSFGAGSPYEGLSTAGVAFYSATFDLAIPPGYDIPLSFVFEPTSGDEKSNYRVQLFVNGYQFGKYVNNIGPQTKFPVPEGILDYSGKNTVAITLWALGEAGAKLDGFSLEVDAVIQSGYRKPRVANLRGWEARPGAY